MELFLTFHILYEICIMIVRVMNNVDHSHMQFTSLETTESLMPVEECYF